MKILLKTEKELHALGFKVSKSDDGQVIRLEKGGMIVGLDVEMKYTPAQVVNHDTVHVSVYNMIKDAFQVVED